MHNCSHCQIRLSNHLFRLLSSFILCGFVFQGCLGHFLEVPGAYETYILAYILALRVRPGPTRWKCWKTSIILFFTKSLSSKNPFLTSLPWAGCCWQDGSADHHLALPGQHLQRDQQQLTQRQGGRHFKLIPYPPL